MIIESEHKEKFKEEIEVEGDVAGLWGYSLSKK